MRSLSKKTQYSLRALYALARNYGRGPILIAQLAREESIPRKFLEVILLDLNQHGVVGSRKGKGGGYFLARSPDKVTIGSVIRLIDGPIAPLPCASVTAYRKCDECVDETLCGTRMVMREVRDAMARILDVTTLADVCQRMDRARELSLGGDNLMYYI